VNRRGALVLAFWASAFLATIPLAGRAQTPPAAASPSPSPAASSTAQPAATPRPLGLHFSTRIFTSLVDQSTAGEGQVGPEAPGFINGAVLAPNTPYDLLSSAPDVPGVAGIGTLLSTANYGLPKFDLSATAGLGYVSGSVTNAAYWSESLMPTINPHAGSQALGYRVAFPTHAGQDDGTTLRLSVLSGSIATADGNLKLRGGWFDLAQTDRFVFAPPALTSVNPAIAYAPAESLSSGLAGTDLWQPYATALPLAGVDIVAKRSIDTLELSNAALPSLPGGSALLTMGSFVMDHGEGTRFSAQVAHIATGGTPFVTTVPFGIDPQFEETPQGTLPSSILSGQRETVAGLRGTFHLDTGWNVDGIVEVGRSWYDAFPVVRPGTEAPGGYYHAGVTKTQGRVTASLDLYRLEPRYATIILPYGAPENQWSAAFAWPGQWLKSNYQTIDDTVVGANRQGFRLRYYVDKGPLEVHVEYTYLRQIDDETVSTSTQAGFVDGYYLPQQDGFATLGTQKRYAGWIAWHAWFGDLTLDLVDDELYRPFYASHPSDQVSYSVPQAVFTYSRHISPSVVVAAGSGSYGMNGAFSEPIDFFQRLYFAGIIVQQSPHASLLASFRRTIFSGITTYPPSPLSPNFTGSALIVEQRFAL